MNTHGKRGNLSNWQESYPPANLTERNRSHSDNNYRSLSKPNITSASYAYHNTSNEAFSSSYYPVSKQNSEVHSQSSGALGGGDTTDDNYSTFTDPSPYQINDSRYGRSSKSSSDLYRMQQNLVITKLLA